MSGADPEAPLVVVAPPGSGTALVAAALAASPQLRRLPAQLLDGLPGVPAEHHRLTAGDATPERSAALRAVLRGRLATAAPIRPLLSGPRLAVRVGFLAAALPRARFVVVDALAQRALARTVAAWPDGAPRLPDAPEDPTGAWRAIRAVLEADLSVLDPGRVHRVDREALLARPREVLGALTVFAGIGEEPAMAGVVAATAGSEEAVTAPASGRHTLRFADALRRARGTVLATAPDPGALVALRVQDGAVRAASLPIPRATGVATAPATVVVSAGELVVYRPAAPGRGPLTVVERIGADAVTLGEPFLAGGRIGAVVDHPAPGIADAGPDGLVVCWRPPHGRRRVGGVAVRDGIAAYATTHGGIVVDLLAETVVAAGLDLPCAPRWADGRLWLVEREAGTLCAVDVVTGAVTRIAELGGPAYGLAIGGGVAFVGGLRRGEGGVWAVDLTTGARTGFATLGTAGPATGVALAPPDVRFSAP